MSSANPLVLVVDDDARNRKLAAAVLGSAGLRTVEAANGAEAIAVARESLPDVVLMDLRLPDMDGAEAARAIRACKGLTRVPVVALTAESLDESDTWLSAAGFTGYIRKPIDIETFPRLLSDLLSRRP